MYVVVFQERLALYSIKMKHRIRSIEGNVSRSKKVTILRKWAMMVRNNNACQRVWLILCKRYHKFYTSWALRRWYMITNLGIGTEYIYTYISIHGVCIFTCVYVLCTVVTSLQKYWRGYYCRNLAIIKRSKGRHGGIGVPLPPGQLYQYIKWYRQQIPVYLRCMYMAWKRRIIHTWYNLVQESKEKFRAFQNFQNCKRFFYRFRR